METSRSRRSLRAERRIIGATAPRPVTVNARRSKDYPSTSREHLSIAEMLSSPLLGGPPPCDELVALVERSHLATWWRG